ncbi:hypothetical protein GCM10010329_49110 [Streptomyces spiroverticillatus]|uniref:Uncharacterized protein n=1 Tax=Streptomyces finlayi TaxID=67296 RepID=A0A918X190_9ACTN|nr:hypothetical protein [Streptomyces finlayi]GHA20102.1 hypothetical protein GCM10010329_49110 [Streptomyces spiroverticillatus]GHD02918.1 hypothetical protein GCM10010334_50060 [Streptomyces finlayi]
MVRNALGAVLALAGATAAVWSPFRAWNDGRRGRDYRIEDLFDGITDVRADLAGSLLLPFVFAAVVVLIAVFLRSRLLVGLAGLVTLGFTVLWMVRQGQAAGGLAVNADGTGLGMGVASAAGGGVLMLIAAVVMNGRGPRRGRRSRRDVAPGPVTEAPYAGEPTQQVPTMDGRPGV